MIILKIVVALLMLAIIAAGTYFGSLIGFLITAAIAFVLNGMFNRWDANRRTTNN